MSQSKHIEIIQDTISDFVNENSKTLISNETTDTSIINISELLDVKKSIDNLALMENKLKEAVSNINNLIRIKQSHYNEVMNVLSNKLGMSLVSNVSNVSNTSNSSESNHNDSGSSMNLSKNTTNEKTDNTDNTDNVWKTVSYKKHSRGNERHSNDNYNNSHGQVSKQRIPTSINIIGHLCLDAYVVESFNDVLPDGQLYYLRGHFAFNIAGNVFHGNIGKIYTDNREPVKIKVCKFKNQCRKNKSCDFYHDPEVFAGSTDVRNYIASSFIYTPQNSTHYNKMRSRRIGDRDSLVEDLENLTVDSKGRFIDQTVHDFICSLLIRKYL